MSGGREGGRGRLVPGLSALVAAALVALLGYGVLARSPNRRIDDQLARGRSAAAPAYRLRLLQAGRLGAGLDARLGGVRADGWVASGELQGVAYVLNIWASWCQPCREEAALLERAWRRQRANGVLLIGVDQQDLPGDARRFRRQYGVDYLNVRDPTNATSRSFGATGIPETYFISARGRVVGHVIGVITARQLQDGVSAAVAGSPQPARQGGARSQPR